MLSFSVLGYPLNPTRQSADFHFVLKHGGWYCIFFNIVINLELVQYLLVFNRPLFLGVASLPIFLDLTKRFIKLSKSRKGIEEVLH